MGTSLWQDYGIEPDTAAPKGGLLVLTGWRGDGLWRQMGKLAASSWQAYADLHGFSFRCLGDADFPPGLGHPSWQKLRHLRAALGEFDRVLWVDADTVCTNHHIDIRNHIPWDAAVTASADWGGGRGWSAGVMAWTAGQEAISILDAAMGKVRYANKRQWDQDALHEVLGMEDATPRLRVLPRRALNAVPSWTHPQAGAAVEPWQPGDFLLHASGMALPERLRHLRQADATVKEGRKP